MTHSLDNRLSGKLFNNSTLNSQRLDNDLWAAILISVFTKDKPLHVISQPEYRCHVKRLGTRKDANYSTEQLKRALQEIKMGTISLKGGSKKYGNSLGTISRKSRNKHMHKCGHPPVLSQQEE